MHHNYTLRQNFLSALSAIALFFGTFATVSQISAAPLYAPEDDFIITVKTDNPGTSSDTQFKIPSFSGESYNYSVDCDDDNPGINTASGKSGDYTCNYTSSGTYAIRIQDNTGSNTGFPRIYFNNGGDKDKLLSIVFRLR